MTLYQIFREKDTCKELIMVKKILNGGGSLSANLIKEATNVFSTAVLFSAYGWLIFTFNFLLMYEEGIYVFFFLKG